MTAIEPASSVAVVGCGPIGLSAVQGARIAGASTIIAIDPIRVRREAALTVGATHALDPNAEGDGLIEKVRSLTTWPTDRLWAGGRNVGGRRPGSGADLVVEAAGLDAVTPRLERGPDPTGILAMQQAYRMTALGGHIVTTGAVRGDISLPGNLFSFGGVTHHSGQAGGCSPMRDIPRFVELLEKGQFDARTLATARGTARAAARGLRRSCLPHDDHGDHDRVARSDAAVNVPSTPCRRRSGDSRSPREFRAVGRP